MDIRINSMILQNFKGIKNLEINASGESLKIYGDNATGKTTVFDAFTWLLFGKDSLGRSDFGIKTQDEYGNVMHNLEHSVECELAIDNSILTLKKVFVEKWTKKRGSAEAEFTGHETKYYINEVPSSKGEYTAKIASIIDETLFKIITNPLYFNEHMKWQERRAILLNLCENISDEDILAKDDKFAPLADELKGRTMSEYKKIIQGKQAGINDELKTIPQRIDEANRAIADVPEVNEIEKGIIERNIESLYEEIAAIQNGVSADAELMALKEKKRQIESKSYDATELVNELADFRNELCEIDSEENNCRRKIKMFFDAIQDAEKRANAYRNEWHSVNSEQYVGDENCPTCGQALPTEMVETAKQIFNTSKVKRLEEINARGKECARDIAKDTEAHDEWTKKLNSVLERKAEVKNEIARVEGLINDAKNNFSDKVKVELVEIDMQIAEAEKTAQNEKDNIGSKIYPIQEQINEEKAKLAEIDKAILARDLAEKQKQRIAELSEREKALAGEYANLEKTAFLIDEFIKFKVEMLSEEINSHFKYAKFKLFDVQINGGIAECCETTYKGVDYSDLNNAARISIGIDIINTLCKLNDTYVPVIVDNAESITDIPQTVSQMICLVVSADDKTLRVEKGE